MNVSFTPKKFPTFYFISYTIWGKLPLGKQPPRKLPTRKLLPRNMASMKIPPNECSLLLKLTPAKITPQKFARNYESSSSPLINHTNRKKYKITKFFALKKAVQHNILIKITKVLFDTQMILGLDTFFTEWKKSRNWTKARIAKWHLLASCTSQGELNRGSQTIKFGKYVKLLNSQLSLHIISPYRFKQKSKQ